MLIVDSGITLVVNGTTVANSVVIIAMETSVFEFSGLLVSMLEGVDIVGREEAADVDVGVRTSLMNIPLPSSHDMQLGTRSKQKSGQISTSSMAKLEADFITSSMMILTRLVLYSTSKDGSPLPGRGLELFTVPASCMV